jgi:small-conductance mechanosensitive channel
VSTPSPTPGPSSPLTQAPDSAFDWLVGAPLRIAVIIITAIVVRWLLNRAITHFIERMGRHTPNVPTALEVVPSERFQQRSEAVGALMRSIVTAIVFTIAGAMVLGQLGVNLGPLIAGAGIVGVALGFGAQSFVKDFISGVFMILEDQFGVGDVIDTGFVTGTVEDVGLRVTRVRDLTGVVWYVRNGEVIRIGNRSQGWATAVADIPVGYDEDLERVRTVVEEVGSQMLADPAFADSLLEAPQWMGVEAVAGDAVTIRVTARTSPQQQVSVAREIRERLKNAFDAAGITVPTLRRP